MSRLALYFLGPPRVYRDGSAVRIGRRKVQALLAYLAVTAERHSRDELADLLFRELDREHARADIRQTLSLLGDAIGEERLGADRHGVWLRNGGGLWVDVAEYRRLLEKGRAAETNGDESGARDQMVRAAELFRGEFLSGFYLTHDAGFEAWQIREQETLRRSQVDALQRLADIYEACGQYDQAVRTAERWVALDPLEEATYCRLMRLHGLAGRHSEALRQYEMCRSTLERELGEKPGEETERLRERIASGKLLPPREQDLTPGKHQRRGVQFFLFARMAALGEEESSRRTAQLREAVGTARGRVLGTAGPMLCAVFAAQRDAMEAALAAQVGAHRAGDGLRIVLLAGPDRFEGQAPLAELVGRAETLMEAAHPGQVLLSESAAGHVREGRLPGGVSLRCLGAHRMNDLGPAQTLYQLEHPDLPREHPPVPSLDRRPNNLPVQPTPFIGRREELAAAREALRPEGARLVTLTGPAGTGKTRLALQAAAGLMGDFEHGVFFVDLSGLREPDGIMEAIGVALRLRQIGDERSLTETLQDYLRAKRLLLLLDNFEHLLPAAPLVTRLLAECPRLSVLATSREALRVRAEHLLPVPPMRLASRGQSTETITSCEAVRLFAERASAVQPDFALSDENAEAVAEICARLDGLPLAIELAAARVRTLTPQALLGGLEKALDLLTDGPRDLPARQQTLRGEMDWSHALLDEGERLLFRRLSVFPAGFTPGAAEDVCLGEGGGVLRGLSSLACKSLVRPEDIGAEPRFRMLETIRAYARERLAQSGEGDAVEQRFAASILQFAEQAEPELYGPRQKVWFERIETEYDNIRAALSWLRGRGARVDAVRVAGALGWFWFRRGRFSEGQDWLEQILGEADQDVPPGLRAKASYYLGWLKLCGGGAFWGNPLGREHFRESLRLWQQAGDRRGIALSQVWLGWKSGVEGADGWALADESVALARETGDPWATAWCLKVAYSSLRRSDKDLEARRAALEEAITLARAAEDPFLLCQTLTGMGNVFAWVGELEAAEPWYRDALAHARQIDDAWSILDSLNCLGDVNLGLGHLARAKEMFGEGLRFAAGLATRGYQAWFIGGFSGVAKREGRLRRALRLGSASELILNPGRLYDPSHAEQLGIDEDSARNEWTAGQGMTLEQAVAYALSDE